MPIEQHAPGLTRLVDLHQEIEELAHGFGGERGPAEGPVWWQEDGSLLFSDIGNNRRMKWSPGAGATLVQEPTNEANGLTRDRQGRLVACEHLARRVTESFRKAPAFKHGERRKVALQGQQVYTALMRSRWCPSPHVSRWLAL